MALTTPAPAAADEDEAALRAEFPEIKDPHTTALAELEKASTLISSSERSVLPHPKLPVAGARPTGAPLVAQDAYGSRFLVAAPFGYETDVPDHWYAWDVDTCWVRSVVAAGTFGSADEALDEWRAAVGTAADSELLLGDLGLVATLLGSSLQTGPFAEMLQGNEPRELICELYRMRRRARVLAEASFGAADEAPANADKTAEDGAPSEAHKAFRAWYRERHPGASKGISATAETIMAEWGGGLPIDGRSFFACSPFRVAMTAFLTGDNYEPAYVNRAIRLLPEWVEWCAQRSGISDDLAAPSIAAARTAADALDNQAAEEQQSPTDTTPFRHREG